MVPCTSHVPMPKWDFWGCVFSRTSDGLFVVEGEGRGRKGMKRRKDIGIGVERRGEGLDDNVYAQFSNVVRRCHLGWSEIQGASLADSLFPFARFRTSFNFNHARPFSTSMCRQCCQSATRFCRADSLPPLDLIFLSNQEARPVLCSFFRCNWAKQERVY